MATTICERVQGPMPLAEFRTNKKEPNYFLVCRTIRPGLLSNSFAREWRSPNRGLTQAGDITRGGGSARNKQAKAFAACRGGGLFVFDTKGIRIFCSYNTASEQFSALVQVEAHQYHGLL